MEKRDESSVKLVGFWVSPFVHRVRWALKLKGVEYEYIEEDIFNKSPLLSELNPLYKKVPVLVHDGKPLSDSSIILEYVDQKWRSNPLFPDDPYQRAQAHLWARFADEKVLESAWLALCSEGKTQERAVKQAIENLEHVEEKLKGKRFFGGDIIGHVDLMMGFISYMLPVWEEVGGVKILDPHKFPAIAAWTNNFLNHEAIKAEYLPPTAETSTYFQWRRKELIPVYASYGQ
ncbi:glutathione transferase GST 23-like [Sesamum indicum]|uniref:Probable glutathione S-transferase n=1 Tax=Sesamum indicum TaxID=4182 RepID=A0A6I9TYH6_SESIN|nr:glutathione transferase GST 23-like [Sesamum indicum]